MEPTLNLQTISVSDLAALYDRNGSGLTPAQLQQTRVPLGTLKTAPKVFQPRDMADRKWVKDRHIDVLVKSLRDAGKFDHIDVFAIDGARIVVDGHCRLEAYRKAGWKASDQVPVRHLRGTFADALTASASMNSKDKLALTIDEKAEAAWRMVRFAEHAKCYSLRHIAEKTGIGKSTVGTMRHILTDQLDFDPREFPWRDVKRRLRGEVSYDEDWEEKWARAFAERLRKHFGEKPNLHPHVFLEAIELAYPRAFSEMLDALARERHDDLVEIGQVQLDAGDF